MLFKAIVTCVALGAAKPEPFKMEPQFEASDEGEVRTELLPEWLEKTGHAQAEGTDVEISEVVPTVEPEAEPEVEKPKRRRGAQPEVVTSAKTALVAGESTREDGAIYMGHDSHGNEVWDPPSPSSEPTEENTKPDGETEAQR